MRAYIPSETKQDTQTVYVILTQSEIRRLPGNDLSLNVRIPNSEGTVVQRALTLSSSSPNSREYACGETFPPELKDPRDALGYRIGISELPLELIENRQGVTVGVKRGDDRFRIVLYSSEGWKEVKDGEVRA